MPEIEEVRAAARILGLEISLSEMRRGEDIASAFVAFKSGAEAPYVCTDPLVPAQRARINTLALAARLPTIYGPREHVEAGGLMSDGANFPDLFRRSADYVDKILRGGVAGGTPGGATD